MYELFDDFKLDALNCGTDYYSDASLKSQNIDNAFKIYQHAKNGTTLLDADGNTIAFGVTIVGRLALKVNTSIDKGEEEYTWIPSDESFPSIDEIMKENLGILTEESTDKSGSILNSKNWSLLGSIHAVTEFHFASPISLSNLWDENMQRITVTAREIIGITAHGYEICRPNPKLESVAICIDKNKAMAATLITYKDYVKRYVNRHIVSALLRT
jgi:hypothetical protein